MELGAVLGAVRQLLAGQLASMLSSASCSDVWPAIQAVISVQKVPEPTAPGIWSEPSKTNAVESYAALAICRVSSFG